MPVITAEQAPTFDAGGATITGLASPSRGATDTAAWRVRFAARATPRRRIRWTARRCSSCSTGAVTARYADHSETGARGRRADRPGRASSSRSARTAARQKRSACFPSAARRYSPASASSRPGGARPAMSAKNARTSSTSSSGSSSAAKCPPRGISVQRATL